MGKDGNVDEKPVVEVIIPALNEAASISDVLLQAKRYASSIIVIDGRSEDGTGEIAGKLGARVLAQNGRGKGGALRQAFEYAQGDIIVTMDADGSMRPSEIASLVGAVRSGAQVAKGSRFLPAGGSKDLTRIRRLGNLLFVKLVNRLWSTNYTDLCYGFAAFDRGALRALSPLLKSTRFEIETEIFIKAKKVGLKVVEVPSIELPRRHGRSNLGALRDGLRILLTIFSELLRPVRWGRLPS